MKRVALGGSPKKPSGYLAVPYFPSKSNPFDQALAGSEIGWPEGERDTNTLVRLGLPSFTFGGTSGLPDGAEQFVADRQVVIFADNDVAGLTHADSKAARCHGMASTIKVIKLEQKDVSDWANVGHTADHLKQLIEETPEWKPRPPDSTLQTGYLRPDFDKRCNEADFARLAVLPLFEYGKCRVSEAKKFGIPVGWLDRSVFNCLPT
jgi:hypothetical protein